MGRTIGICNQKGGTGKTTTAINLASYLALANRKTLLIDMDPQGNATSGTGVNRENKSSIYEVIMGDAKIEESIYPTEWPNLFLIPSHMALTGGEIELVNEANREGRLKRELEKIKEELKEDAKHTLSNMREECSRL